MRGSKLDKNMLESKVFDYIQDFTAKNGFAPAIRDICKGCEIKSTATVYYVINSLCDKGLLRKPGKNMRRAVGLASTAVVAPLIGNVDSGTGLFNVDNYEDFYSLPNNYFYGEDLYVLSLTDDGMQDAGILKGDKVVFSKQDEAADGDLVVVIINGNATVKKLEVTDSGSSLVSANSTLDSITADKGTIIGKVVGVMRNFF